jgi:large subunit ribosomal protein L35
MKSQRGAKKRFKVTGTGKIKRKKANKSHILTKKSRKRKRSLRQSTLVADGDLGRVRQMI